MQWKGVVFISALILLLSSGVAQVYKHKGEPSPSRTTQYCAAVGLEDAGDRWICGSGFASNSALACSRGARQSTPKSLWERSNIRNFRCPNGTAHAGSEVYRFRSVWPE